MAIISAPRLLVDGELTNGAVVIENGIIVDVLDTPPRPSPDHLALPEGTLTAGLVDVQINGSFGVDFIDASDDEWELVAHALPRSGVTAFQPTYITAPMEALVAGLNRASAVRPRLDAAGGARMLGVHVEGPFLSPLQAGVHDTTWMVHPSAALLDRLLGVDPGDDILTMVTLAPELPGAIEAIERLVHAGIIVSIGHTNATAAEVHAAVEAGARMVTHIFNAQRGFGHREPGVPGEALTEPRLTIGLIADLRHVARQACTIVMQAARGRVALVTDAVAAAGMPPGIYQLGGQQVEVPISEGLARRVDGTIAGSSLSLDRAVRNLVQIGCDTAQVLDAATRVPADALRRTDIGRLAAGAHADLAWWSDDLQPLCTWIGGEAVYTRDAALSATRSG